MFDADTVALISSAPPLPGLDLADLPRQLTDAYATLVSARIRLRGLAAEEPLPEVIEKIVSDTRRLAFAQEALVSVLGERENRAAAAFVAGAAHHVVLLAEKLRTAAPRPSRLALDGVSPEISATILLLIAESSADAAEMAKAIVIDTEDEVEARLLASIVHLANGRLQDVLNMALPNTEQILAANRYEQAVSALYLMLLKGVREMASTMLGESNNDIFDDQAEPRKIFEQVKALCVDSLDDVLDAALAPPYSVYPGPLHLASLLLSASRDLLDSALVNTPPPPGVGGAQWLDMMRGIAKRRPYLWRNHRKAVAEGYLEPGVSSAISFPTGAGKSTLSELKIAAALLRGVKVVFLAPTLALVDQTARSLAETFPDSELLRERPDQLLAEIEEDTLPAISVMTPERCLAMLSFNREIFSGVGLLVFDECHLLHPRHIDGSRRAIDAMLAVLNFVAAAPVADLLFLSAMMSNTTEMAGWLQTLTERKCLSLALTWKPTRQVRGCVVYGQVEVNKLKRRIREVRAQVTNKDAPAELRRKLNVTPFGFFCLHQTWQSKARKDYALLPLLEDAVTLSTGTKDRNWYLTPNGNQVASAIAGATAAKGLKTLVFTQTVPLANSAANTLLKVLESPNCPLTGEEKQLYDAAVDECGGAQYIYLQVDAEYRLLSSSVCHHGLLLQAERLLHESVFRRRDGIHALVATSTLAQGMNLPSEVVIIGGDSRFDEDADRMEQLAAHELLNAAGRAGRAGDASYGFVLVVPSKVVDFDDETSTIHNHWTDLQTIFAQSDQCLAIDDPLSALLDQIHGKALPLSEMATYLLRRLPVGESSSTDGTDGPARTLLKQSFAAFRARQQGNQAWIQSRVEAALIARRANPDVPDVLTWEDRLAASAGVPVGIIHELGLQLSGGIRADATLSDWYAWLVDWLTNRSHLIPVLVRQESLEGLFGKSYKKLEDNAARGQHAVSRIFPLLDRWMAGDSLAQLEGMFGTPAHRIGKCEAAREFVLRVLPEIAYIFGLPAQIYRALSLERGDEVEVPPALSLLGPCVREGFDRVEKLILRKFLKSRLARRAVHREFASIEPLLAPPAPGERFKNAYRRVANAVGAANLL